MKELILLLLLIFLSSCNEPVNKKTLPLGSSASVLAKIEGNWELCTTSGGTDGDYKITHVISGTSYYYTEYYYLSHDGSCTNPIVRTSGVQLITKGSGSNAYYPEALAIDLTFPKPLTLTALTGDVEAMDRVISCTSETAPSAGVAYNITKTNCGYVPLFMTPVVAGQKGYTYFYLNTSASSYSLSIGGNFSSSSETRDDTFDNTEYPKK